MTKTVRLKKNEDRRIATGHLWAFSNEISEVKGDPQAGDIVSLLAHSGKSLGRGFYHPNSLIAVRLLTRQEEEIDFHFFHKRIEAALTLRSTLYPGAGSYRLVHGEGDYLSGLIVDRYNDCLVVQTFSFGMDRRLTLICDVLESLLHPAGIAERNDFSMRSLEGLEQKKGVLRGTLHEVQIVEEGLKYAVDMLDGQKTGFFLDQHENRKAIRRYAEGARVLDCFSNDGGFALNAVLAGAVNVTAVDVSAPAIARGEINAALNGFTGKVRFLTEDAFEYLRHASGNGEKFDLIVLDPPGFAKSKKTVQSAKRGYSELHELAFRLLERGGILATASCSHHIYEDTFKEIVNASARSAGKQLSLLEWRGASPDHPTLLGMPETHYLKFGVFHAE